MADDPIEKAWDGYVDSDECLMNDTDKGTFAAGYRAGLAAREAEHARELAEAWDAGWKAGQTRYRYELGESAPPNPHREATNV